MCSKIYSFLHWTQGKTFLASVGGALLALNISLNNIGGKVFALIILTIGLNMVDDVIPQINSNKKGIKYELLNFFLSWLKLSVGHVAGTYVGTVFDNEYSDDLGSGIAGWIVFFLGIPILIMIFEKIFDLEAGATVKKFTKKSTRNVVPDVKSNSMLSF